MNKTTVYGSIALLGFLIFLGSFFVNVDPFGIDVTREEAVAREEKIMSRHGQIAALEQAKISPNRDESKIAELTEQLESTEKQRDLEKQNRDQTRRQRKLLKNSLRYLGSVVSLLGMVGLLVMKSNQG